VVIADGEVWVPFVKGMLLERSLYALKMEVTLFVGRICGNSEMGSRK